MISPPPKTTLELAKEVGYTEPTFQQDKQIAKSIVPEVKEIIKGTPIAKSTTALLKVASAGSTVFAVLPSIQVGDEYTLDRHLVYCSDTSSNKFRDRLQSNAALAIATPSPTWNHDYLVNEARIVAVLRREGDIHEFLRRHQMLFRFELLIGDLYVAIFSHQSIPSPHKPITISGVEGIVAYLASLYTNPGNFVIAPFVGNGEVLITCERMGRICNACDENPELVSRAIARWQKWTGKQPEKTQER